MDSHCCLNLGHMFINLEEDIIKSCAFQLVAQFQRTINSSVFHNLSVFQLTERANRSFALSVTAHASSYLTGRHSVHRCDFIYARKSGCAFFFYQIRSILFPDDLLDAVPICLNMEIIRIDNVLI